MVDIREATEKDIPELARIWVLENERDHKFLPAGYFKEQEEAEKEKLKN